MNFLGLNSPAIFLILVIILIFLGPKRVEKGWLLFQHLLKFLLRNDDDISKNKFNYESKLDFKSELIEVKEELEDKSEEPELNLAKEEFEGNSDKPRIIEAKEEIVVKSEERELIEAKEEIVVKSEERELIEVKEELEFKSEEPELIEVKKEIEAKSKETDLIEVKEEEVKAILKRKSETKQKSKRNINKNEKTKN